MQDPGAAFPCGGEPPNLPVSGHLRRSSAPARDCARGLAPPFHAAADKRTCRLPVICGAAIV